MTHYEFGILCCHDREPIPSRVEAEILGLAERAIFVCQRLLLHLRNMNDKLNNTPKQINMW